MFTLILGYAACPITFYWCKSPIVKLPIKVENTYFNISKNVPQPILVHKSHILKKKNVLQFRVLRIWHVRKGPLIFADVWFMCMHVCAREHILCIVSMSPCNESAMKLEFHLQWHLSSRYLSLLQTLL